VQPRRSHLRDHSSPRKLGGAGAMNAGLTGSSCFVQNRIGRRLHAPKAGHKCSIL
jgi:hypothetical protein